MARLRPISSIFTLLSALTLAACGDDGIAATTTGTTGTTDTTGTIGSTTQDATGPGTTAAPTSTSAPTSGSTSSETGTSDTSTGTTSTGTGTSTSTGTDTTTGGESTTGGVTCTPGQINCDCDNGFCEGSAICGLNKCLPAGDGSCPYEFDFYCDEPDTCAPGSDPFDCCASQQNGICEEFGLGGDCPPYSDFYDCGYCPFVADGSCDAPDLCADGTDEVDCCATPQNGVCEELGQGGACPDGSDPYDCGVCIYEDDGLCDVPGFCPEGTDLNDCCATPQNGVCEEMQAGGQCPDGSDPYDCGVCPFEDDFACDVPNFCPEGTDLNDCCATPQNGVCEEMQAGGQCPDGTDPYDCGVCVYENDFACDVPDLCPEGTDLSDCCATPQNGVCEEMQAGGQCPDGSDPYDCGVCLYEDDFECDVPLLCPEGTDLNDCA